MDPKAHVRLSFVDGMAVLQIEDNGRGSRDHSGLTGIKERTEALTGGFQFVSAPGKGTTMIVKFPLK